MELEAGGTGDAARKTAVLQAVWKAMAASPQDSAQAAASLLNRADSSLPQASAAEMAQLLAYSLETAVLPLSSAESGCGKSRFPHNGARELQTIR